MCGVVCVVYVLFSGVWVFCGVFLCVWCVFVWWVCVNCVLVYVCACVLFV